MSIYIREEYVNATKGVRFGDSGSPQEAYTDDIGELFRSLRSEFGQPKKMYVDRADGSAQHTGWVFTKRCEYQDYRPSRGGERFYLREAWITLYDEKTPGAFWPHLDIDAHKKLLKAS